MSAVSPQRIDTPDTVKAMKSILTKRRMAWAKADHRDFPKFVPGDTTTAGYVAAYLGWIKQYSYAKDGANDGFINLAGLDRPAPFLVGPEVIAELIPDAPDIRVPKAAPAARSVTRPTTTESTMPKTTTNEKHAKINAYLATQKMAPLTPEQCDAMLKANAMSPKRVIRGFKDAAKAEPAAPVAKPETELAATIVAQSGIPAGNLMVAIVGDKPKRKASAAAAH